MPTQSSKTSKKESATPRRPRSTRRSPAEEPAAGPVAAAPDTKYAPTVWGAAEASGGPQDLTLPSGQLVLARRPGAEKLMVEGVLHKMDNLTALVDSKHVKKGSGKKPDEINVKSLLGDPEAMAELMHTVDRVLCAVVLQPHVEMAPNDPTRRRPGVIYADTVDLQDKMFIFNFAMGGSKDLERFRRESEAIVGGLEPGEAVGVATE